MSDEIDVKIKHLRNDFKRIKGYSFDYFFCPVLFKDEKTELCKGHIINQAFRNSARAWTVQRKDVDGFYGHNFESEFISLEYNIEKLTPIDVITNPILAKKLKPKILIDNQPVNFFPAKQNNQSNFTRIDIENNSKYANLVLKLRPEEVEAAINQNWEIEINTDLRLAALVSLIKLAHLTLFELLGYLYAYSSGGYFIGKQILGEFFIKNQGKAKAEIKENAYAFFQEFNNMVRPIESLSFNIKGTITDEILFVCKSNHAYWAFIVFIRTSKKFHSVIIPIFDQPENVALFMDFLKRDKETHITGNFCRFDKSKSYWEIDKNSHELIWPRSQFTIE